MDRTYRISRILRLSLIYRTSEADFAQSVEILKKAACKQASGAEILENIERHGGFMKRTVITVVGKDKVGIIARVCTYLADNSINILDISQTIVQGFFHMMMIVDATAAPKSFEIIAEELEKIGAEIGVIIRAQHEDIFDKMHRI